MRTLLLKSLAAYYFVLKNGKNKHDEDTYVPSFERSIESFNQADCKNKFRFLKGDLKKLVNLLRFPEVVSLSNRKTMKKEEVFLRGLYELSKGMNQDDIASDTFGLDQPTQSRAFTWFVDHIYATFHHLVHDNLGWWYRNGFFKKSAQAIGRKMGFADNLVAHFIDCNCLPTSRVGGGPMEDGANARRWHENVQRAFYNGWKSISGLKHQTVDNAYGLTVDMTRATSLRKHDVCVLHMSRINFRMAEVQDGVDLQYIIGGDNAYRKQSHITSYHHFSA